MAGEDTAAAAPAPDQPTVSVPAFKDEAGIVATERGLRRASTEIARASLIRCGGLHCKEHLFRKAS